MYTHHSPVPAPRPRSTTGRSPPPRYTSLPRSDTYSPYARSITPVYRPRSKDSMIPRVRATPGILGRVHELGVRTSSMRSTGSEGEDGDEDGGRMESGSDSEDECTGRYIYACRGTNNHDEGAMRSPQAIYAGEGAKVDQWMEDKMARIAQAEKDDTAWRRAIDARAAALAHTPRAQIHAALASLLAYRPYAPPTQGWLARLARAVGAPVPDRSEGLVDAWGNPTSEWVLVWLDVALALCVGCGGRNETAPEEDGLVLLELVPHAHDHLLQALWVALIYVDLAYKNDHRGEVASALREKIVREWGKRRYWGGYARWGGGDGWSRKVRAVEGMGERRTLERVWGVMMDLESATGDGNVKDKTVTTSNHRSQRDHVGFQEIQDNKVKRERSDDDECISDQSAQAANDNHANAERWKMRRSRTGVRLPAGGPVGEECSANEAEKADECWVKLEREESVRSGSVDSGDRLGAKLSVTPELKEVKREPDW
ncbi:hypothetical protein IAT38_007795 [Cryptococcus sp. DSM 104549]